MKQMHLFPTDAEEVTATSTFGKNMNLPVHRWFRYSAGFSAEWAESVIADSVRNGETRVLDPFAGSGTTLLAAESLGVASVGVESHPFVSRIARAKLASRTDPSTYHAFAMQTLAAAKRKRDANGTHPELIEKCFHPEALDALDKLRLAFEDRCDGSPESELTWLTLVSVLRSCSHVGTAQWQYILPNKSKKNVLAPFEAFAKAVAVFKSDMTIRNALTGPKAKLFQGDARECADVPEGLATLVITSPPYPNNYDYADATRLEMTFMREIAGWGDLQETVRKYLVRSCSQHVPERAIKLEAVLAEPELAPIRSEITEVCTALAEIRKSKGGKKTYHLMVATYFHDLARVWLALRRSCDSPSRVCFVIGDSAPYGVYVPVVEWMTALANAAGFGKSQFVKLRDRNIKWKNRKHRVPLCEGELWIDG